MERIANMVEETSVTAGHIRQASANLKTLAGQLSHSVAGETIS